MKQYLFSFRHGCIGYVLIKLKYYYNVTSYKSFINTVYDLWDRPRLLYSRASGQFVFVISRSIIRLYTRVGYLYLISLFPFNCTWLYFIQMYTYFIIFCCLFSFIDISFIYIHQFRFNDVLAVFNFRQIVFIFTYIAENVMLNSTS